MSDTLPEISLVVDQAAIAKYAAITNDFNPIHLDADFAAKTPMKGIIAHGTMSLGLLWQALGRAFDPAELSRLAIDIRFVRPVRIGDTVTAGGRRREG
ncbi:MAG: acyl dehydratase, partial [Alphaproteobacteria bacterium]|nr:acyl dehydratase [Alphaproteobacteria bacterium]